MIHAIPYQQIYTARWFQPTQDSTLQLQSLNFTEDSPSPPPLSNTAEKARGNTRWSWREGAATATMITRPWKPFGQMVCPLFPSRRSLFPPRWMSIDLVIGVGVRFSAEEQWIRPITTQSSGNQFFIPSWALFLQKVSLVGDGRVSGRAHQSSDKAFSLPPPLTTRRRTPVD